MAIETKENEKVKESRKSTSKNTKKKTTKKKNKKKMETSKILLVISYTITIVLTILVVIGTFIQLDISNLTQITALSYGETSCCTVWYYKKAAKENVPKVIASLPQFFQEQVDVNQLLNQD